MTDALSLLVRHGHSLEKIGEYPFDVFVLMLSSCRRHENQQRIAFVNDLRMAIGSVFTDKSGIDEYLAELRKE